MGTLLRRCAVTTEPCLTILSDNKGQVFGCVTGVPWCGNPLHVPQRWSASTLMMFCCTAKQGGKKAYGNGQSFLFSFKGPRGAAPNGACCVYGH